MHNPQFIGCHDRVYGIIALHKAEFEQGTSPQITRKIIRIVPKKRYAPAMLSAGRCGFVLCDFIVIMRYSDLRQQVVIQAGHGEQPGICGAGVRSNQRMGQMMDCLGSHSMKMVDLLAPNEVSYENDELAG